jgi:Fe2+ transport system protein FeoA
LTLLLDIANNRGMDEYEIERLDLTDIRDGESVRILCLRGGREAIGKLEAMGIGPGSVIKKKSTAVRHGPIVIGKGSVQLALGYDIARGITVERIA